MKKVLINLAFVALIGTLSLASCKNTKKAEKAPEAQQTEVVTEKEVVEVVPEGQLQAVAGTYKGEIPGADCTIETTLTLNSDGTYALETSSAKGKEKPLVEKNEGKFKIEKDGIVVLEGIKDAPSKFKIGENQLTQLDMEGHEITGELAAHYILKKQ